MTHAAAGDRYAAMSYRRTGRSGLDLPVVSLGLANDDGPPHGAAEADVGRPPGSVARPGRIGPQRGRGRLTRRAGIGCYELGVIGH